MLRPRIIPCLLIKDNGLVKTTKFRNPKYVGDPINAVRIFNEKEADELIILDIDATAKGQAIKFDKIQKLALECRMPLCYGGGVKSTDDARKIIELGVEKVAISSIAISSSNIIQSIANEIGSQSVVVVLDVKKKFIGNKHEIWTHNATINTKKDLIKVVQEVQLQGAGEVVLNFIEKDGTMSGYPIDIIRHIKPYVTVPLTVLGGAASLDDISKIASNFSHVGLGVGSLFVFKGKYKAVLINYPSALQKQKIIFGE